MMLRSATLVFCLCAGVAADAAGGASADPRSHELLRYQCESDVGGHQLTLFANGTLRLRETQTEGEERRMRLAELGPAELAAYRNRLAAEDLSEVRARGAEMSGDWVERCSLWLELPDRQPELLRFGRLDTLPLPLARLLTVVDDLLLEVDRRAPRSRLPLDYEPRPGDRLLRVDGNRFEVVAFTSDGRGVELLGLDVPLVIYLPREALTDEFEQLLERRP